MFDGPANWPEGTEVRVEAAGANEYVGIGMREEDWPTTPEGIAALIERMDKMGPFLTPEEDEAWRKALAERKAWELANWEKWTKEIGGIFQ